MVAKPLLNSNFAVATWVPSGAFRWVVMLCGASAPPSVPEIPDGAGDPVQIAGVVPGVVDACCRDEHALSSATQLAADNADMVAAAILR